MDKLMLLDGNSLINRAFYGIRLLTTKDGVHTNAVYGFINMLAKYREELQPTHILVAFDVAAPTFRHHAYTEYKSTRSGMPPELKQQIPLLKEVLSVMNIAMVEKEGYEADDLIGTVARECEQQGAQCVIVTGDRDDLQLISSQTNVYLIVTRQHETTAELWDEAKMQQEYHIRPAQFVDVKALMGDKSDNIPGVAGIGPKRATELIMRFGSVDGVYQNIDDRFITPSNRKALTAGRDMAYQSRMLCEIDRHVPIPFHLSNHAVREPDTDKLTTLYKRLEFRKLLKKLEPEGNGVADSFADREYRLCTSLENWAEALAAGRTHPEVYIYFHPVGAEEYAVGLCTGESCAVGVPGEKLPYPVLVQAMQPLLEDERVAKTSINLGQLMVSLAQFGIAVKGPIFDVSIGAYLLKPSAYKYAVEELYEEYIGIEPLAGIDQFGLEQDYYACARLACCLAEIKAFEQKRLEEDGQRALFEDMEMPLVPILANMQIYGFRIDRERLEAFRDELETAIGGLEAEIYQLAGETFNLSSTRQLGSILFEKLGLHAFKKNKTGYSTSAEALERIVDDHPIVEKIIAHRQLAKLKSTYADGLLALINPETGKIHSKFNQTVAVTGRISSQDPNIQSIPARTEQGRELRKVFVASSDDYVLCGADYSQIELRVLAHLCGDDLMVEAFRNGGDIHAQTAAAIFGVPREDVTPIMRTRAKAVNFGIIYGMGDYGLAEDLHIPRKEAKQYIEDYFRQHPKVDQYMKDTVENAKRDGYVTTMFHRRRYVPELTSSNFVQRGFGTRVAMNAPIQGTAADIIKLAMIRVNNRLRDMKSRLILQVHDELIVETHISEVEQVKELLRYEMEHVCELNVPLEVEVNVGKNWYETK